MLSLCCHANSSLLGAATGMNTFPVNSAMLQHHCTHTRVPVHTGVLTAHIRHHGANSDATNWSYRAPMMINKQHFGWEEMLLSAGWRAKRERGGAELDTHDLGAFKTKTRDLSSFKIYCMFEDGAEPNTSCLKKNDARVE